ncbi:MAG: hypothetical protein KAH32_08155 [Chlamydiia bacterium]|nr:hypothetical protein [Chlamydiia bacterium]
MSGNTSGQEIFSDGYRYAPMMPDFPEISKCKKCGTIVWLNEENEVEYEKGSSYTEAHFLGINDYQEALNYPENNIVENEIKIRRNILWLLNDTDREDKYPDSPNITLDDVKLEDIKRLIDILDYEDFENQILLVELYRYLGEFDKSKKLLSNIYIPDLDLFASQTYTEIENKNTKVFKLKID